MTHQPLALKHRPQKLADLVGQEHVTAPLSRAIDSGRVHSAYILSGSRGCGKTTTARIIAMSLNCLNSPGPTSTPCGTCTSCTEIREKKSLDVVEIDAASNNGVDDARDLVRKVATRPAYSRFKVFILDEAHMVTPQGFNALLKAVEEPPEYVRFIFCTTEPDKIITTIQSRSFRYNFHLVGAAKMVAHLSGLLDSEGIRVDKDALPLVARAGGGSVRDSLMALDQLISGTGGEDVSLEEAGAMLGLTSSDLLEEAVDGILARDASALFGLVDKVVEGGTEIRRFSSDLLERLRDLVIVKTVPDALDRGLVGPYLEHEAQVVARQSALISVPVLTRVNDTFTEAYEQMGKAKDQRLVLEMAVAKLISGDTDRLVRVEQMLSVLLARPAAPAPAAPQAGVTQEPVAQAAPTSQAPAPAEVDEAAPPAPEDSSEVSTPAEAKVSAVEAKPLPEAPANPAQWADVVAAATSVKKATGSLLANNATVTSLTDGKASITLPSQGMLNTFEKHREVAEAALKQVLGSDWVLEASVA